MGNYRDNNNGGRRSFGGNRSFGGGNSDREMFKATCASCGKECEIPFRPSNGRPVYCRDCFKKNSPQEQSGGRFSRDDRRGDSRGDRQMFAAVCDNCGDNCQVPFQPTEGKTILCSKCFEEKGGDPRRSQSREGGISLSEVNEKLDRILELLSPATTAKAPKTPKAKKSEEVVVVEAPDALEEIVEEVIEEEKKEEEATPVKKTKTKKKSSEDK